VIEAEDGLSALAAAKKVRAPSICSSTAVVRPKMSSGELAKEFVRLWPGTKFLFVSGYPGKTILDHKVVDLETNFRYKPYTLKQLSSKIRAALGHSAGAAAGATSVN